MATKNLNACIFTCESLAHLQGRERELLPATEGARRELREMAEVIAAGKLAVAAMGDRGTVWDEELEATDPAMHGALHLLRRTLAPFGATA